MDTNNKDSMRDRDIEVDLFNIEEGPDAESEAFTAVKMPPHQKKYSWFPGLRTILIGGVLLLSIAALVYFLPGYVRNNFISKDDTIIIQYQLSQINEKLEQDAADKEGAEKTFSSQFSKLSERMDDLEVKLNFLKNKDSKELIMRQFDLIALRIDAIEDKINALSENVTTITQEQYYEVRRGESLTAIAQKHDLTVKQLCALNNISAKQKIYPGQRLVVRPPLVK